MATQTGNIPPGRFPDPSGKHLFIGPNYQKHGEMSGYIYNAYTDKYRPDPKAAQGMGLIAKDPAQPGLLEQVAPLAIGLSVAEAAKYGGQQIGPAVGDLLSGGGSGAATGVEAAYSAGSPGALGAGFFEPVGTGVAATPSAPAGLLAGGTPTAGATATQAGTAAPAGGMGLLGAVPYAGLAGGLALGAKGVKDLINGQSGTDSWEGLGGRATLGIATGGISELARLAGLGRKSTRDYAKDKTNELSKLAPDDAGYQAYLHGARDQYNEAPKGKAFGGGKYNSWDEYQKAGLDAGDLTHVYGNIKAYGPAWSKLTEDERRKITQDNIDAGNYYSSKGDVLLKDEAKAKEIWDKNTGVK